MTTAPPRSPPLKRWAGRVLRTALLRGGRARRIPWGLAQGIRLEVDARAPLHIYLGSAETEIAPTLRRLARPATPCFDVGSHNAYYALILARLTGGPVAALDFDPAALGRIGRNLALNPALASSVTVRCTYLAHETNTAQNATTLDDLVYAEGLFVPGVIKIDVEGAEFLVLAGARRLLAEARPALVIETHTTDVERRCAELLIDSGYRVTILTQRRWWRENRPAANRWLVAEARAGIG